MKNYLSTKFAQYLESINFDDKSVIEVLKTKDAKFGDYTSNIAMRLTKQLGKAPMDIAQDIKEYLESNNNGDFKEITVTNPGFVNLFLSNKLLIDNALKFVNKDYKPSFETIEKKKINYEYVSANPTGYLHIGHARQAAVGQIAINALRYVGHDVFTEYYLNDGGVQMNNLGESVFYYYALAKGIESGLSKEDVSYNGPEIIDLGNKLAAEGKDVSSAKEMSPIAGEFFLEEIKRLLREDLKLPEFDKWTSEKQLIENELEPVVARLKELDAIYEAEDATFLKTEEHGDEKDRVIVKSDGTHTYLLPDIANHLNKAKRGFDLLVDLWGKDHHGYEARVQASMELLEVGGILEVDFINMVHVTNGDEVVKMSKRAGTALTIREVIASVNPDTLKYSLVSKAMGQNMEIDINEITKEDLSNPYYYVQYSNARAHQIIEKYKNELGDINILDSFTKLGEEESEKELISKMAEFEDMMITVEKEREPSLVLNYQKELAQAFNTYYAACRVITNDSVLTNERINLIVAVKNLFTTLFEIEAIDPINKI